MKTVLIPPILDWGFLKQLPQQIATQFARNGYRVYFCNNTFGANKVEEVEPNLFVYHNHLKMVDDLGEKRVKIDVLYNTWAKNQHWVDMAKPKLTIYHSCDVFDEWKSYEKKMIDKSDIILCTSKYIYDIRKEQHNNVHLVRNACTSEFIDAKHDIPDDMMSIDSPICLFAGAIGEWVSTYLLKATANNYKTIFVGKEFGKQKPTNIIDLGLKPHDKLINYYYASDICLLPFNTKSEITQAANPIKIWEYLSCGKPVIATSWEETELDEFSGVVFTSKTNEDFIANVHKVAKMTKEERDIIAIKAKEIARNNTWEKRFEVIDSLIRERINV